MSGLRHRALLYRTADEQAAVLAPLVTEALDADRPVLAVLDAPQLAALDARVGPGWAADRRVEVRPPAEVYGHPARTLGGFVELIGARGPGVTLIGEAHFGTAAMHPGAWVQAEAVLNAALAGLDATVVCAYHRTERPAEFVASAGRTHPELYVEGVLRRSAEFLDPARFLARHQPEPPPVPAHARTVRLGTPADLWDLRRVVARAGTAAGLGDDLVADLVLAVGELATNAVEHGRGPRTVALWTDETWIACEVANAGAFTDPLRGFLAPVAEQPRGRGVFLSRLLCDGLDVWAGEGRVRVQARMQRAGDGVSPTLRSAPTG